MNTKPTNPKDAVSIAKVPLMSVLPLRVLAGIALALLEGARKYGRHNYRVAGVRASVYLDACGRHLAAFTGGRNIDPDSGLHEIDKAIASLCVLRDSIYQGNWVDDRPPAEDLSWLAEANAHAARIVATVRPDNPEEPYTELNKGETRGASTRAPVVDRVVVRGGEVLRERDHAFDLVSVSSAPDSAFDPSVAPAPGTLCLVTWRDKPNTRATFLRVDDVGDFEFGVDGTRAKNWYRPLDPENFLVSAWRPAPSAADESASRDYIGA